MPVTIEAIVDIIGPHGNMESVALPVIFDNETWPVVMTSTRVELGFAVQNTLPRQLTLPAIALSKTGPAASKLSVHLLSNSMVLPALGMVRNTLILTPNNVLIQGDEISVQMTGAEG